MECYSRGDFFFSADRSFCLNDDLGFPVKGGSLEGTASVTKSGLDALLSVSVTFGVVNPSGTKSLLFQSEMSVREMPRLWRSICELYCLSSSLSGCSFSFSTLAYCYLFALDFDFSVVWSTMVSFSTDTFSILELLKLVYIWELSSGCEGSVAVCSVASTRTTYSNYVDSLRGWEFEEPLLLSLLL